jgi:murein L,D-transpeptidase YcbB/YkuD
MQGERTVQVDLDVPISVLIVYATAIVLANGEVHFFNDIYGHDAALEWLLSQPIS